MIDSSYSASDVSTEELKPQAPEKFGVFDFTNDKLTLQDVKPVSLMLVKSLNPRSLI